MTTFFLKWWFVFVIQAILIGIVAWFGGGEFLLENDRTFISFGIIGIWLINSLSIGYYIFRKRITSDFQWFVADSCMSLGMIGTVIGFIFMLGSSFENIDPSNVTVMKSVISDMAKGMSTALLTTLSGLIATLMLRVQLVIADLNNYET